MNKRTLLIIFSVIEFLFLSINVDIANCFNISHSRIEITVAPSKVYTDTIAVKNTEKAPLVITIRTEDWAKAAPYLGWLEVSPMEFELKEGESKEVKYEVNVPKDAKGELSAMIFIDGKPKEIAEGSIGINTSIGVPIYVMIKGTEKFNAEIEELNVVNNSPLELAVTIKNSGNVHIRPTGTIEIRQAGVIATPPRRGKQSPKMVLPLNEYNYPILPNSSRTLEIKSNSRLEKGEYTADMKMGFADRKYRKRATLKIE